MVLQSIIAVSVSLFVYLIGAIPFSLIVTRLKGVRIEDVGSGNLGATNVYRALGLKYAIFVFLCDFCKGFFPVFIAIRMLENLWLHIMIGLLLILAHSFSIFVRFVKSIFHNKYSLCLKKRELYF